MTSDYCSEHCVFTIYQKTLKIQSISRFDLVTSICRVRYSVTFLKSLHLLDNSHRAEWVLCMWSGNLPTCTFSQFLGSPPSLPGRRSFSSSHNPPQLTWKRNAWRSLIRFVSLIYWLTWFVRSWPESPEDGDIQMLALPAATHFYSKSRGIWKPSVQ